MGLELPDSARPWRRSTAITGLESKVLGLAAMGHSDPSISAELGVSRSAIASNWRRILSKVGATSRADALRKYEDRVKANEAKSPQPKQEPRSSEPSANRDPEEQTHLEKRLLTAIADASVNYINGSQNVRYVYSRMLDDLLAITQSHYGLIAQVHQDAHGLTMGEYALTCSGWNAADQAKFEGSHDHQLTFEELDPLFVQAVAKRTMVIENDTAVEGHHRSAPAGHPIVQSFLGIPIYSGLSLVGVLGLANRRGGYSRELAEFLKPIVATCANITVAWQLEMARRDMQQKLDSANCLMRTMVDRSESAVMYETADRKVNFINRRFADLFGLEATPAQVAGMDTSLIVRHSQSLLSDPQKFADRVENLVEGQESCYDETVTMANGRSVLRDFVVVRSGYGVAGYFWHYRM